MNPRHARPLPPRKPIRTILRDAWFWSASTAITTGTAYWAALQWVDALTPILIPGDTLTT